MTKKEALETIANGGEWPDIVEAIAVVACDPMTSYDVLIDALKYPGLAAEQAAFALYRRSFRPLPDDRRMLATDADEWRQWLNEQSAADEHEAGYSVQEIADAAKAMGLKAGRIAPEDLIATIKLLGERKRKRIEVRKKIKSARNIPHKGTRKTQRGLG